MHGSGAEEQRVAAVRRLGLLDTAPQERFEAIVRLCQAVFGVPMAAVNLIDEQRQFALAQIGLHDGDTPRLESMCHFTVAADAELVVPDMLQDERFRDHASVTGEKHVRFYAGVPLRSEGETVGSLCLVDDRPRELTDGDLAVLRQLADLVQRAFSAEDEMARAHELQQRLLPRRGADVPGLDIAGRCSPSRELGGDFYDWQPLGESLQLLVADVMGKGLAAALIAASVRAVARGTSLFNPLDVSVGRVATSLASDLEESGSFVTLFAARLDPATGDLGYVDAGHGLACVISQGALRWLRGAGLPVGAVAGSTWQLQHDHLDPGDTLLLLSDGVLDVHGDEAGLAAAVLAAAAGGLPASGTAAALVDRLVEGARERGATDDVTVVAVVRLDLPPG